ncbi:hypothetical protein BDM02DRAFT_1857417 [Thelephora ganbajun]|uniref:Uncharacterized protein n=1 Tax=Thelephora ganbajun TaxID=370292 RepID=A0ACB6YZY3_THEGA|nr:hypothetical protein BDM02DRAFT_1857417 [Thelephora ganbajun]
MSHASNHLRFGIEVEFLLSPREAHTFKDIGEFANFVLAFYKSKKDKSWPNMHVDLDGSYEGDNDTIEWSLSDDASIKHDKEYPIELISPILHFKQGDHFRDYVKGVWDRIVTLCIVGTNNSCGTHVHVSPSDDYTSAQVKAVARAVLYFESTINALVPAHRLANEYCKSFFASNEKFKGKTVEQAIAIVDKVDESHPAMVAELMNPDRYYTWNFTNLYHGRTLTIEFRQGEGVATSTDALAWAEFVVTFIGAAITAANTYNDLKKFDPNVGGLKKFLEHGAVKDVSDKTLLGKITGRAKDSGSVSGSDPGKLSKEREDKLAKKKKEDDRKQIFAKKMTEDEKKRKK